MSELVSIIIPVYNMEDSLEACVNSILKQDYSNIEIILVDDGSKDNSFTICKQLKEKDSRIVCVHTENRGSGPARNEGIKISKGSYLYFPDADDYLEPIAISRLIESTENGKYDLIVFGYKCVSHEGQLLSEFKYNDFTNNGETIRMDYKEYFGIDQIHSVQGAPWNKFFSGEIIRKNNIEYPPLRRHQDEGFISRYMSCCENVKFIPDILYTYYPNTVGLEWKKYPVDYIDAVVGLYDIWKETICKWNPNDIHSHTRVEEEYLTKVIKALEMSYSPKLKLNVFTRNKWLRETCQKANVAAIDYKYAGSKYQLLILKMVKGKQFSALALLLYVGNIKNHIRQR